MEQFVAVAVAHFLALLIPGVDFVLIIRTTLTSGWRNATGVCLGIATANGMLITAAFSGLSLISHPTVLAVIQTCGGVFLVYVGVAFIGSDEPLDADASAHIEQATWARNFGLGLASGLLNPKNALFYLSLASLLTGHQPLLLVGYGVWMFSIVLLWDMFVAVALGSRRSLARIGHIVPRITTTAGVLLVLIGIGMIATLAWRVLHP